MIPKLVGVTGLPRAGSTLLCQLLAGHPDIHCEGHSSPLCNLLLGIRRMVSDDTYARIWKFWLGSGNFTGIWKSFGRFGF